MRFVEFYAEKQGRPESKVALDMETRAPSIPGGSIPGILLQASYTTNEYTNNYIAADVTVILVDAAAGNVTITLPEAVASAGRYYYIKKVDGSPNRVTVQPDSAAELIDGETSQELRSQYAFMQVICSGTEMGGSYWHIVGGISVRLEDLVETAHIEQKDVLEQILMELKRETLHLASMTDEDVDEE